MYTLRKTLLRTSACRVAKTLLRTRCGFNTNFTHSDILEPCTLIHFGWWEISIENQNVWGREILVSSIFVGLCSLSMCTYSDVVGVI